MLSVFSAARDTTSSSHPLNTHPGDVQDLILAWMYQHTEVLPLCLPPGIIALRENLKYMTEALNNPGLSHFLLHEDQSHLLVHC